MANVFRGVFYPHPLQPTPYGILSVARLAERVEQEADSDREEHWVRGYSHMFETNPTIRLVQDNGVEAHVINDATGDRRFIDVKAFFIEVEDYATGLNANKDDRRAKIVRQIEAGTQKAVEHEFYHGFSARANNNDNQYLTKSGSDLTIVNGGTVALMHEGLGYLEYAIAQSPIGEQGVIHMTRDMVAMLGSQWIIERADANGQITHVETVNGTPVVIGSGYDGSGPKAPIFSIGVTEELITVITSAPHGLTTGDLVSFSDVADPTNPLNDVELLMDTASHAVLSTTSATTFTVANPGGAITAASPKRIGGYAFFAADQNHKWMWATGIVDVNLGKVEVTTPEGTSAGWDSQGNKNDLMLKAIRPAAVHHEPMVHAGVKVQVHE